MGDAREDMHYTEKDKYVQNKAKQHRTSNRWTVLKAN